MKIWPEVAPTYRTYKLANKVIADYNLINLCKHFYPYLYRYLLLYKYLAHI